MSDAREEEYDLSDGQRLTVLEGTVNTNRTMLIVMVLLALVGVSVAVTVVVIKFIQPKVVYVKEPDFKLAVERLDAIEEKMQDWRLGVADAKKIMDSSSATAFKEQLLAQEQSYQIHLSALKQGMRDLARMIPGSRTWLDIYNEKMDLAIEQSEQRQLELERLQTRNLTR